MRCAQVQDWASAKARSCFPSGREDHSSNPMRSSDKSVERSKYLKNRFRRLLPATLFVDDEDIAPLGE
jgi:hypothetical protein